MGMLKLFALLLLSVPTFAAVPLQPAQSGLYYDPLYTGQGVDLKVIDREGHREVFAVFYIGRIGETNRWAYAQGNAAGSTKNGAALDLREPNTTFGATGGDPTGQLVGDVTIYSIDCKGVIANVTVANVTQQMFLQPLILDNDKQCYVCPDIDFGPADPACD